MWEKYRYFGDEISIYFVITAKTKLKGVTNKYPFSLELAGNTIINSIPYNLYIEGMLF